MAGPHPLGPDAPRRDFVGLAFVAMGCGIASGTAVIAVALWAVRSLLVGAPASDTPNLDSMAANVLLIGTAGGILFAAVVTWRLLHPVGSTYRQGGLSIVAGFATLVVSLVAVPVNIVAGRWGLLILAAVAMLLAARLRRGALHRQQGA